MRDADLVVRLGGDEFVMLFDGLDSPPQLHERAKAVVHSLGQPLRMDAGSGTLGVNVGGAIFPLHGRSESALMAAADQAMYQAKQAGEAFRMAGD